MAPKVIQIPTLNDDPCDFQHLFSLWEQLNGYFEEVRFDFSQCRFLRPNAVAFLGGLGRLIESRLGNAVFDWTTVRNSWVMRNLEQNGFAGAFGHPCPGWSGHSIPYRQDAQNDPEGYATYLSDWWLGRGWVHVSQALKDAITDRVLELYVNAFEHSGSEIGVFSCGQHFRRLNELTLAIVDFGVGIPATVRNYLRKMNPAVAAGRATPKVCMEWAFQRGTTTQPNGAGRGLGLDLLKAFVRVNAGSLEVYSNDGYARITDKEELYQNQNSCFEGTVAYIRLNCDEKLYFLSAEAPPGQ